MEARPPSNPHHRPLRDTTTSTTDEDHCQLHLCCSGGCRNPCPCPSHPENAALCGKCRIAAVSRKISDFLRFFLRYSGDFSAIFLRPEPAILLVPIWKSIDFFKYCAIFWDAKTLPTLSQDTSDMALADSCGNLFVKSHQAASYLASWCASLRCSSGESGVCSQLLAERSDGRMLVYDHSARVLPKEVPTAALMPGTAQTWDVAIRRAAKWGLPQIPPNRYHWPQNITYPEKLCPNYFSIIVAQSEPCRLNLGKCPIPSVFVWAWHCPPWIPFFDAVCAIAVTRFALVQIKWVILSWQMVRHLSSGSRRRQKTWYF